MLPIGYQIYLTRLEQKLTQGELARKAGLAQPNLSNIEKGKQDITLTTLRKIGYALGVRLSDFFAESPREGEGRIKLTRPVIEKMAKAIVKGNVPLNHDERQVVGLFRDVLPGDPKRIRIKRMHQSWLELKKRFHSSGINALYERVQELGGIRETAAD